MSRKKKSEDLSHKLTEPKSNQSRWKRKWVQRKRNMKSWNKSIESYTKSTNRNVKRIHKIKTMKTACCQDQAFPWFRWQTDWTAVEMDFWVLKLTRTVHQTFLLGMRAADWERKCMQITFHRGSRRRSQKKPSNNKRKARCKSLWTVFWAKSRQ